MQLARIEASPRVQTLTLTDPNTLGQNCTVFCPVPLSLGGSNQFTISRDMSSQALEELLNSMSAIQEVGGAVKVYKDYNESEFFAAANSLDTKFTIVYLTTSVDVPTLSLDTASSTISCEHTNTTAMAICSSYDISAVISTAQEMNVPSDFTVGFSPSNQPPRWTRPLLLNATEEIIDSEISDLFAWGCESDVDTLSQQGRVLYRDSLEDSQLSNAVNDTSFCGHYSERNPGTVWRDSWFDGQTINPDQHRFVSHTIVHPFIAPALPEMFFFSHHF